MTNTHFTVKLQKIRHIAHKRPIVMLVLHNHVEDLFLLLHKDD